MGPPRFRHHSERIDPFRSRIFGGLSAEVLTVFNGSDLAQKLKGTTFCKPIPNLNFADDREAVFKIVPADGLPAGTKIGVADSAYARSSLDAEVPLYFCICCVLPHISLQRVTI